MPGPINIGVSFSLQCTASGGTPGYAYSIANGTLPPGLTINAASGLISGVPISTGSFTFTVKVQDSLQQMANSNPITLSLEPTVAAVSCNPSSLASGQTAACYVTVSPAAPSVGAVVNLSSSTSLLTIPQSVTVAAGSTSAGFAITAGNVSTPGSATITATYNSTTQSVSVDLGLNVLIVTPALLSFFAQQGGTTVQVGNAAIFATVAASNFTISAKSDSNWLKATASNPQTPAVVTISVDPSGVSPGQHPGSVTITGTDTSPASMTVSVTLTVQAATTQPQLTVNPSFVDESVASGGPSRSGQLVVANTGGGTLQWTASQIGQGASWLTVSGSGTATPTSSGIAIFTVNPAGLEPGTYSANIEVSGAGQVNAVSVPVTLVVAAQTSTILLPVSALEFYAVAQGPAPASQQFAVMNIGSGLLDWAASACTYNATSDNCALADSGSWLEAAPASGSSPAGSSPLVTISVNPSGLAAGDYFGAVQIAAPSTASNSPQALTVQLHVLTSGEVAPPTAPSGTVFVGTVGGPNPATQNFMLTNAGAAPLTFSSTSTQNWLTLTPASGNIAAGNGTAVSLSATTADLTAGVQQGEVWVAFSDGTVREINVALVMVSAGSASQATPAKSEPARPKASTSNGCSEGLIVTLAGSSPPNLSSNYPVAVGSQAPVGVEVTNCSDGSMVTTANGFVQAAVTPNGPSFDLAYQGNGLWMTGWPVGDTTGPVTVTINASLLSPTSGVNSSGSLQVPVTVVQNSNTQVAQPAAVLNAASYEQVNGRPTNNVTPGSLVAIFGTQMADKEQNASVPFPGALGNVIVTLGGQNLPLNVVSPTQINALIPWELNAGANQLYVVRDGTQSNPIPVTVVNAQPAIFTTNQQGTGQGAILIANTATIAGAGPGNLAAARGGLVEIYCTGLGPVSHQPPDGTPAPSSPLAMTLVTPTVTIGGKNAPVTFSGLAPGFTGLYQVDAQVPGDAPTGSAVPVVIALGSAQSPPGVTMAVR